MPRTLHNIQLELNEELSEKLQWMFPHYPHYQILRQSIDARSRQKNPKFIYSVRLFENSESSVPARILPQKVKYSGPPILIVGAGPAGLFAALRALEKGIPCEIFERGSTANDRIKKINRYWRYGELDENDNVCFGEGGAGLYSDGKLITRIKSPYIPYVMQRLVEFGAPGEIEFLANPHVGSDRLRRIITPLRKRIIELGGKFHFNTQVVDFIFHQDQIAGVETEGGKKYLSHHVLLATGHSATDIYEALHRHGVFMESKDFAMGLRIEHPQEWVNRVQYKKAWDHPKLGSANYRLSHNNKVDNIGIYSFCMCPGGYVVNSSTEVGSTVSNGMSNYNRNSPFANSAVVMTIGNSKSDNSNNLGQGMIMRDQLERAAFEAVQERGGKKELPAQRLSDFLEGRISKLEKTGSLSGALPARLDQVLPPAMKTSLIEGFNNFNQKMKGFISPEAVLFGVESRTSSPIRITRDPQSLQSLSHKGLYPVGEGAGYAGGITSSACDGIKTVEQIAESHFMSQSELAENPSTT